MRNLDTNIDKTVTSDNAGYYVVGYLIPGHYEVLAEKTGFHRFVAGHFQVGAGRTIRIDCPLQIGSTNTQVTVQDAAPAIATESSNISASRSNRHLEDLPLNTRGSWDSFIYTYAGMMPGAQPGAASYDISFDGLRSYHDQFPVDGIATTSTLFGDILGPANPSMDAIEELKVDASVNNAEFQAPASISVISKSGSNTLPGRLYGRFDYNRLPNHSLEGNLPMIGRRDQLRTAENGVLSDTNTFSPKLVNEFKAGLRRAHNFCEGPLSGPNFVSQFGLQFRL